MDINKIHEQAELSQAAYADFVFGDLDGQDRVLEEESKILAAQAANLASRYEVALATYNEPVSSFSATVFKNSDSGDLTLAIRGSGVADWITTNPDVYFRGAGYAQIVALYNWWQKVSNPLGQMVKQFAYKTYIDGVDSVPEGALLLYKSESGGPLSFERSTYLVPMPDSAATGELTTALTADSNHKVSVTGHSLGGHLAMAFGALFPEATEAVIAFDAPGFKSSTTNQTFFQTLNEAAVPTGTATTNVIADSSTVDGEDWSIIAGLHSLPGAAIDISIEDQVQAGEPNPDFIARNHSQMILTDSLAVYSLLNQLDPSLTTSGYKSIFDNVSNSSSKSYERIVDVLETFLSLNNTPLMTGNNERNALYKAIYSVQGANSSFKGQLTFQSVESLADHATADNAQGQAYRYALLNLNPFAIVDNTEGLYTTHNLNGELDWFNPDTGTGTLTTAYLEDRAAMLATIIEYNATDKPYIAGNGSTTYFHDEVSGITISTRDPAPKVIFGGEADIISGGGKNDHLYGDDDLKEAA